MSYPQTAESQVVPIPLKGMNWRDPLLGMNPQYSPWIQNFDSEGQYFRHRPGFQIHQRVGSVAICGLGVRGAALYAYVQPDPASYNEIWDVTAAPSKKLTLANDTADDAFPMYFNGRLAFGTEANAAECSATCSGTTWTAWTGAGAVPFTYSGNALTCGVSLSYQGRVYIFQLTNMYYSALSAVSGPCSLRSVSDFFPLSTDIMWAGVLSSPGSRPSEVYMAIGGDAGEVLVYSGEYPDSPTWSLAGRYKIAPPLFRNSIIELNNDIWILTTTGAISLRLLMTQGSIAEDEDHAVSAPITPYWVKLANAVLTATPAYNYVSGAFWPEKNKVFIFFPAYATFSASGTTRSTMLVYDVSSRAWSQYSLDNIIPYNTSTYAKIGKLTYFKNNLYLPYSANVEGTYQGFVMKFGSTFKDQMVDGTDAFTQIPYELQGAYNNFSSQSKNKVIKGWEPIVKTDFAAVNVGMQTNIDVGRVSTNVSHPNLIDGVNVSYYVCGGKGSTFQWVLKGTSDIASVDGLELYSMGVVR